MDPVYHQILVAQTSTVQSSLNSLYGFHGRKLEKRNNLNIGKRWKKTSASTVLRMAVSLEEPEDLFWYEERKLKLQAGALSDGTGAPYQMVPRCCGSTQDPKSKKRRLQRRDPMLNSKADEWLNHVEPKMMLF